ncbi:MAG: hypothetical protein QG567_813, partial [Campylobacterota bacterium]|nr:hypothetical protein [Campylobacterota bacterium]
MRLLLILFVFAFSLYAEIVSKNILIIDGEKSFFSKSTLPNISDYSFSSIEPKRLSEDVLATYDTVVLFQSDVPKLKEKEAFLRWVKNGGKLIIMNKESKTPYNRFDWLDYGYVFATNTAASNSKNSAKYAKITEYNFLTKSLDIDNIDKNTNAFADSTVMIFSENLWNSVLEVTNSNDVTGSAFAYSKYGKGIFIYFGLNIRDIHKNGALKDIYRAILELPWFPDPLPYTNATGAEIPPPLVRISGISSNKVDITWKIPAWLKGIRGYKIYRSSDNGETKELLANVIDASFYRDLSAIDGNSYLYFVTSYDDSRDSSFSEPVKALPPGDVFDEKEMSIITPDGENTTPVTALTTADNFDHIVGDALLTSQKISGDPVSLATGGFYLEVEDIKFPMKNTLLEFSRSYNSIFKESNDNFRIGNGWRHNYMITINPNSDGTISIKWGDGHSDLYLKSSDDGKTEYFEPASNRVYAKLKKTRNEGYTLTAKDKKTYKFDDNGKLLSIELLNKGGVNFEYDYDKLIKITDKKSFRFINIGYEKNNISKVCAMDKICVFYSFDEKNNLIKAVDAKNNAISYEYNDKYQMVSSKSGGIEFFRNEYSKGQITRQLDAVLNETKFEYLPEGVTKATDREGRVFEYKHDSLGRLVQERDPFGGKIFYHYNTRGEVEKKVNKDNTAKEFGYDEFGNKIFAKDESLNTKTMEYDKNSN